MFENTIQSSEEKPKFQLFFLKDNENQSVEVVETEEINLEEVRERIERGESAFITRRSKQQYGPPRAVSEGTRESWYFTHI